MFLLCHCSARLISWLRYSRDKKLRNKREEILRLIAFFLHHYCHNCEGQQQWAVPTNLAAFLQWLQLLNAVKTEQKLNRLSWVIPLPLFLIGMTVGATISCTLAASFHFFLYAVFSMQTMVSTQTVLPDVQAMTAHPNLESLMPSYIQVFDVI